MNLNWSDVQKKINYQFKEEAWLREALCHKSYNKENPEFPQNEKLEFLGATVLDLILSDLLMQKYTDDKEGSLSRKRASVVNEDRLSRLGKDRDLDQFLLIGEREAKSSLRSNSRIIASVFEAVVGAIYRDGGFDAAFSWVETIFVPVIDQAFSEHDFEGDYKTRFQEWVQEKYKVTPRYKIVDQSGPDHARTFEIEVFVGEDSWGTATGSSKKMAAQNAAKAALTKVKK